MHRKSFLSSAALLLIPPVLPTFQPHRPTKCRLPNYLRPGDTIGISSPAGFTTLEEMKPAMEMMKSWGFQLKIGSSIGKRDFTRGGTDQERLADFQQMLDDREIKAIMCARGGYGSIRIVDRINWKNFAAHPKWIIGFSDITVLHSHVQTNCKVATLHSKMTNSFPENFTEAEPVQKQTIEAIRDALTGVKMQYAAPLAPGNRQGNATGVLVGGNLKTLETLSGTSSDINTRNKILFVEDTGEYLYSIDRMFWNLKRTGKLDHLAALIVGGFKIKPDDPGDEFGKTLQEIVLEKLDGTNFPVCFDFPVGHQKNNFPLKCGVHHQLQVRADGSTLRETD